MGKLAHLVLIVLASLALLPFTAVSASAASPQVVGIALDEQGKPLRNVSWNIYHQEGGEWVGLQMGPLLTDAAGRFEYGNLVAGTGYRVCFSDSYYGQDSQSSYWLPEVRHRDTCWPNATSVEAAQTWTAPADGSTTFTVTLPQQGLGMAPVDPFVVGSFNVGEPLTVVGQEGWRPTNAALSYQWYASDGGMGSPIPGATAATFTPTAAQSGKWVQAVVTATLAGYKPVTLSSQITIVGATHAQLTSPLKITGTAAPGQTVTASFGKPTADSHSILDWFVDGIPQPEATIQGSETSTFAITGAMAGANIEARLSVYLTNDQGYIDGSNTYGRAIVQAAGTRPAQPLPVAPSSAPAVASSPVVGVTAVGGTLRAPTGLTADPAATASYQWLRDAAPIAGATAPTYQLQTADIGHQIAVTVTLARPGWWDTYVGTTPATGIVQGLLSPGTVKITGKAKPGKKLKKLRAKTSGWGPVSLAYQWQRNGKAIKGATKASYKLKKKDRKKRITVVVTATRTHYLPATATSKPKKIKR